MNFDHIFTVTFTLFAIIDMLGNIPILISISERIGQIQAWKATSFDGILMLVFLFINVLSKYAVAFATATFVM